MARVSSLIAILSYAVALCGVVPIFQWLTPFPRLVLVAGMAAGIWQDRTGAWPLRNWMLNAATITVFLFYASQISRSNMVQPVVSIVAIMLAVRLLARKDDRHYLQIHALSLFCLASSSLFDLSPSFLLYLSLMLFLVAVTLVLLTFYAQDTSLKLSRADLRRVVAVGLVMPLASLPLLIFFFPLLPRTQLPLWNISSASSPRASGFSEKVEAGASSVVGESRQLVFRAEMPRQPHQQLYWRGTVFNRFENNRWVRDVTIPPERITYEKPRISQMIYPEPGMFRYMIALDAPVEISSPRFRRFSDGVFETVQTSAKRTSYRVASSTSGILAVTGTIDRDFYLRLPAHTPDRIRILAETIRVRAMNDSQKLEQLESHFRNGGYRYTLRGLPTGDQALERFLFEGKQGHCEFFATAYALVARSAGVPARLVGGYMGGEYNELGGYYLVSEHMAHVWVEVFIEGQGWLRIDPSSFAGNADAMWSGRHEQGLAMKFKLAIDSLDHAWNRSVITYDFERQVEVARSIGTRFQNVKPEHVVNGVSRFLPLLSGLAVVILVITKRRQLFPSAQERLLRSFFRRVERDCGVAAQQGKQGLFELARLTGNGDVLTFAKLYGVAVYHDRKLTPDELRQLRQIVRKGFLSRPLNGSF